MKYKKHTISTFLYGLFAFAFFSVFMYYLLSPGKMYISSRTGTQCYIKGHEPNNLRYKVYHNSLRECESYIINFQ